MKAISLKEPWAGLICSGRKTIETRTWSTAYRGPLLICASKQPQTPLSGKAVAVCELVDCRPMTADDEQAACCRVYPGARAWVLRNVRAIEPFEVKGELRLFEVNAKGITTMGAKKSDSNGKKIGKPTISQQLTNILTADAAVQTARGAVTRRKVELKQAREDLAAAENRRDELAMEARRGLPGLFEGQGAAGEGDGAGDGKKDWRDVLLADLRDPPIERRVIGILARHKPPITTIGQWVDWQADKGDFAFQDVKGLGKRAADSVADAMEAFWARRKTDEAAG